MHSGKQFSLKQVLFWTRRDIFWLLIIATVPTYLYAELGWKWVSIPWLPIALLGTAVAFIVGFKNNASYERMWEARKSWGSIVNSSRSWGIVVKDFITNHNAPNRLDKETLQAIKFKFMMRHFAWLTALRFQLREARVWEAIYKKHNQEFKGRWFHVEEHDMKIEDVLANYLDKEELALVLNKTNRAAQILALQSDAIKDLNEKGFINDFGHVELEKLIQEFYNQQGACERIKNFPYPRQYATLNLYFIRIFIILVPLGMLQEFNKMGECLVWLSIPFSALSAWIFTTLEKIGESTESPFEGSANDVPITALSRTIEIDLREMYNDTNIPEPKKPENNILI